ncbi:hypothetical protein [Ferrovibrio sp.]|uniref:hypothetical protein n=1 Tax=Ferrovibrio sp. TaxID=1917215 RepID=UPI003D279335
MKKWWIDLERRFKGGVIASVFWLTVGLGYAWVYFGWEKFWCLKPNELGDFFAGLSAPLAFLWLVLGYMQQGEEIKETRVEIKRQADSIAANESHARRDTFFKFAELITEQLMSLAFTMALSKTNRDNKERWMAAALSDRNIPFNLMLDVLHDRRKTEDWINRVGSWNASTMANRYKDRYEVLAKEAEKCDPDKVIRSAYNDSSMGQLYVALCRQFGLSRLDGTDYSFPLILSEKPE